MRRLFAVEGLACGNCARGLEHRLTRLPAVRSAGVHHLTASALIDWDEERMTIPELRRAVAANGYRLIDRHCPEDIARTLAEDIRRLSVRLAVAVVAGMWVMALSIVLYSSSLDRETAWWLASVAAVLTLPAIWAGRGIFWMALRSLHLRTPGMDILISLGVLGACGASLVALATGSSHVYFDTATMLVGLLLAGRLIDAVTRRQAIDALTALQASAPETAFRENRGARAIPCGEIKLGERIAIDAGAPVTMDGIVVRGESLIDRAVLTGESCPATIGPGGRVEAGAINLLQRIVIETDRVHGDREIDRMGGAIALEIARKGAGTSVSERIAAVLAWAIPAGAIATSTVVVALGIGSVEDALLRGLTLLTGACPCALAIAAPLAQARAAFAAAPLGLRIRDPSAFESLGRSKTIVFDKTGTLTAGKLQVVSTSSEPGWTREAVIEAAAGAETGIDHPLARSIVAAHGGEIGKGGLRLARSAQTTDDRGRIIEVSGGEDGCGQTVLRVGIDGQPIGTMRLSDQLAKGARETILCLSARGMTSVMATGDGHGASRRVAEEVGIPRSKVYAALTPQGKCAVIAGAAGPVAFVGDGVNDAPALAAADCGISVSGAHSAAAQTADLVIVRGGIDGIVQAVDLSRRAATIGRQNIVFALVYNLAIVPFAIAGTITPVIAALAMTASSTCVLANSLRLSAPTKAVCDDTSSTGVE